MNDKFIASVNRRFKYEKKNNPNYSRGRMVENILSHNVFKKFEDITDYQIDFFDLFQDNDKLQKTLEKQLYLLSNEDHYRGDNISYGDLIMLRELRPPEDKTSTWQLLYETTVHPDNQSGPIMHLYFDGWELKDCKIYYWDESPANDISEND